MSEIFECGYGIEKDMEQYFMKIQRNEVLLQMVKDMKRYSAETFEHSVAVAALSGKMGERLGYAEEDIVRLKVAGLLHDIGKLTIPLELLHKKGELTKKEREVMQTHVISGYSLLLPFISDVSILLAVRQHHERLDGTGYPDGISDGITEFAKVVMLADVYDGMTRQRTYRSKSISDSCAKRIMEKEKAGYDSRYLSVFLQSIV